MPIHTLMNVNYEVARVIYAASQKERLRMVEILDSERTPLGLQTKYNMTEKLELSEWWRCRSVLRSCPGLELKLASSGVSDMCKNVPRGLGLSLSDCYWLRPEGAEALCWEDVNYFDNDYIVTAPDEWDARLSGMDSHSPSDMSEVELPKRWVIGKGGVRHLLKGCRTDDQRPYNELVATRLFGRLLLPEEYVPYDVMQTPDGPVSVCPNFLQSREEFIPAAALWGVMEGVRGKNMYEKLCITLGTLGIDEDEACLRLAKMVICDAVLANVDRHWRNFGIVRNVDNLSLRLAPLFDTGNCLWYSATDQDVERGVFKVSNQASPSNRLKQLSLSCLGSFPWFDFGRLEGFAEQACEILAASRHASKLGRLEFVYAGIINNMQRVMDASAGQ